jgi:hypothetical protein
MFRFAKNATAALALTGLVLSQPAMAVRSSESLPAMGAKVTSVNRSGSPTRSSEDLTMPVYGWVLGAFIVIGVIIIIATDNNDSPG